MPRTLKKLAKNKYEYDCVSDIVLQNVARWLWLEVWWNDEREWKYAEWIKTQDRPWEQSLEKRPETPSIPDPQDALSKLREIVDRIESAWQRGFVDVAFDMEDDLDTLVYRMIMSCIGHGIGPDDDGFSQRS